VSAATYPDPGLDPDAFIDAALTWLGERAQDPDLYPVVQVGYRLALIALERQGSILRLSNELAAIAADPGHHPSGRLYRLPSWPP
jgi:hypothetical protein